MGACCSCHIGQTSDGYNFEEKRARKENIVKVKDDSSCDDDDIDVVANGDCGAIVRLQGSSKFTSMYTQQGKKGVNQDAMTVWENFIGERDMFFCGVFDGHGPSGHKVARHIRDNLPSKVTSLYRHPQINGRNYMFNEETNGVDRNDKDDEYANNPFYSTWKDTLINSFKDMDENLECESSIDSYCSGTTAVTLVKKGNHLMVANLGDSRAVLCTRDDKDILLPVQLTVDLKPNLPSEAERIRNCKGRVLAMEEEPTVFRIWMPDQDCPGLAMARAFGDFCLKDFGLISTPEVYYRKLTEKDEFVVIATDGIWDTLSNIEVMKIVASARNRSMAAKLLVERANRAWRYKYPNAKIDDCAAICLFFKKQSPSLTKSLSEVTELSFNYSELGVDNTNNNTNIATEDGLETVLNCDVKTESKDDKSDKNVDPTVSSTGLIKRRRTRDFEYVE